MTLRTFTNFQYGRVSHHYCSTPFPSVSIETRRDEKLTTLLQKCEKEKSCCRRKKCHLVSLSLNIPCLQDHERLRMLERAGERVRS